MASSATQSVSLGTLLSLPGMVWGQDKLLSPFELFRAHVARLDDMTVDKANGVLKLVMDPRVKPMHHTMYDDMHGKQDYSIPVHSPSANEARYIGNPTAVLLFMLLGCFQNAEMKNKFISAVLDEKGKKLMEPTTKQQDKGDNNNEKK